MEETTIRNTTEKMKGRGRRENGGRTIRKGANKTRGKKMATDEPKVSNYTKKGRKLALVSLGA